METIIESPKAPTSLVAVAPDVPKMSRVDGLALPSQPTAQSTISGTTNTPAAVSGKPLARTASMVSPEESPGSVADGTAAGPPAQKRGRASMPSEDVNVSPGSSGESASTSAWRAVAVRLFVLERMLRSQDTVVAALTELADWYVYDRDRNSFAHVLHY